MPGGIPFSAALFDLDGTLLDSLGVWRRVDDAFFAARGLTRPEDYSRAIAGMSFSECAAYTIARFGLRESAEAVMEEWMRLSEREYAENVALKPGALSYLRMLKRAGVKLAVATANQPRLFEPTLARTGALELFDAVCTTRDVGDTGKADGALFRLAAARLGVAPEDCAVFEDVPEGIVGARAAGMRAYALWDVASRADREAVAALADGAVERFDELRRYHAFPDNARRGVIFTARCDGDVRAAWTPRAGDVVFCADGGWKLARAAGAPLDWVLGDFDSSEAPQGVARLERFPVEKDDTDTMLCLKRGLALGLDDFLIVGGFGGRLDHTLANLQTLAYAASREARAEMADGNTWAAVVRNGALRVPARPGKLSVFALDPACRGVSIRGAHYAVEDITLRNTFPLGVSNDFAAPEAEICVRDGALLVTVTGEEGSQRP